jgi:hypothetical protein
LLALLRELEFNLLVLGGTAENDNASTTEAKPSRFISILLLH